MSILNISSSIKRTKISFLIFILQFLLFFFYQDTINQSAKQATQLTEILSLITYLMRTRKMRAKKMKIKELNKKIKRLKEIMKVMNLIMIIKKTRSLYYLLQEKEIDLLLIKSLYHSVILNITVIHCFFEMNLSAIKINMKCTFSNLRSKWQSNVQQIFHLWFMIKTKILRTAVLLWLAAI